MVQRESESLDGARVLITGITGFVGSHLAEHLLAKHPSCHVYGLKRWRSPERNVRGLLYHDRVSFVTGDLLDEVSLRHVFEQANPDFVFHLAAQSYVPYSYTAPRSTLETNVVGTANLLEVIRQHRDVSGTDPIIHICSSSEVYGQPTPDEVPLKESQPFRPISPYGVSKVAEDMLGFQYWNSYQLKTIRTRMFTHTGPRRGSVFVLSAFAKQAVEIEKGMVEPVIGVGNLDSIRTFADVRDAVEAYRLLVLKCRPGEAYNIGGSRTMSIGELLELIIARSRLAVKPEIRVEKNLLRPADVTLQIPDCSRFIDETRWKASYSLEQTIDDTLEWWRTSL